jgi:drug/metabolite transporter (DMT)-like permease
VAYIWMLLSALSFATMGALVHALSREGTSWEIIALVRSVVVLLLSAGIVYTSRVKFQFWRPWQLWARSIAGSVSMLVVFFSFTRLPVSIVVTLINLAPVWVATASWFMLPKTRSRSAWVAIVVGIVGVVLIQQPELSKGNLAVLAPLAASVLLAIVMLALHQVKDVDSRAVVLHFAIVALWMSLFAAFFCIIRSTLAADLEPSRSLAILSLQWTHILLLIATGIAATSGQLFLTVAFAAGPPAKVSVVGLTQVGFALLYDVGIWGHTLNTLSLIGILLVVAPTGWVLYAESHELVEE